MQILRRWSQSDGGTYQTRLQQKTQVNNGDGQRQFIQPL